VKRVLILPRHAVRAASCRHRFTQYLPYLEQRGVECTVSPFFDDAYTEALLTGRDKQWWRFGQSFLRRVNVIATARRYDLVVVHSEIVPFLPAPFEQVLARLAVPYVLDFDDAFFHQYDRHLSTVVRWMCGAKIPRLMRRAAMNVAGSEYLAAYARRFSANVTVIPTTVDIDRYPTAPPPDAGGSFKIGWIGSPSTTAHLQTITSELRDFCVRTNAEILAIGAKPFQADSLPIRWIEWSESSEVRELSRADVAIMPLPSTAWAAGKCGFKLIQAMACWRPVIASPVGANCQIVEPGISGLLAGRGEWGSALERLEGDRELRFRLGAAGRRRVESAYSLQAWAPVLFDIWKRATSLR